MTEVVVKFRDGYTVVHSGIETGTVAYARVAAWLMRFPAAATREFSERREVNLVDQHTGRVTTTKAERTVMMIAIEVNEPASKEIREICAGML